MTTSQDELRPIPKRNERWRNVKTGSTARVMSAEPIEGYIVARYKGSMPWLLHVNDWHVTFELAGSGGGGK